MLLWLVDVVVACAATNNTKIDLNYKFVLFFNLKWVKSKIAIYDSMMNTMLDSSATFTLHLMPVFAFFAYFMWFISPIDIKTGQTNSYVSFVCMC